MKRFLIVLPRGDGGVELHPMKEWLRQHREHLPEGLDPTSSTSHQISSALKRRGWSIDSTDNEVRHIMPNVSNPLNTDVLGDSEEVDDEPASTSFALEYQLRDFIAQNIESIPVEGRRLKLYVDPTGHDGVEYPTAVGPIDILAIDDKATFFVFELKRAQSPDAAIGQLARYMGWVGQTIGKGHQVHGVVVAKLISDKLRYAASVIPNVSLFEYQVEFHLKVANAIAAGSVA